MIRPDLVDVWVFRLRAGQSRAGDRGASESSASELELYLMRRSPGRILAGLWQAVSGSLEAGETIVAGALRELREETGIHGDAIEAFYDLDQVNQFHEPSVDGILSASIFAVRIGHSTRPTLSHEHDEGRWLSAADALDLVVWPAYRESIIRIGRDLVDPERAAWFELTLDGQRARQP